MESNWLANEIEGTGYILSAPAKSGYKAFFKLANDAREQAKELLGVEELIQRESCDGDTVYFYSTEAEADADQDGAYAVQMRLAEGK